MKILLIILMLLALFIIYFIFSFGFKTKDEAVAFLKNNGYHKDPSSFGEAYLIVWANAARKGNADFTYDGKQYNVKGGKVKV